MLLDLCLIIFSFVTVNCSRPDYRASKSRNVHQAAVNISNCQTVTYDIPPRCKTLGFTVLANVVNKAISSPLPSQFETQDGVNKFFADLKSLLAKATNQIVEGNYTLKAEYCQPIQTGQNQTLNASPPLQMLLHGSTYTKKYWNRGSWGSAPLTYLWTYHMNPNSYATLAVDKLGNGQSTGPDPVREVQLPLQMETIHSLISQIKSGMTQIPVPSQLIYVAHSSGSILGATLAQIHPDDVDALVLTGYSAGGSNNPGGIPSYKYLPAAISAPIRFPGLDYGYLLMNSEYNRTSAFYYAGHYDPELAHLDFLTEGTQPLGEGFNLGPPTQPAFKGKVLVVTGQKDPAVCKFTPLEQFAYNDTVVRWVNDTFSGNSGFDYYMPLMGHDLNWHYGSSVTYGIVAEKLGRLLN